MKKLCSEGLPEQNYFNLCAAYLTEFENKLKSKNIKSKTLKELIQDDQKKAENKEKKHEQYKLPIESKLPSKPVFMILILIYI